MTKQQNVRSSLLSNKLKGSKRDPYNWKSKILFWENQAMKAKIIKSLLLCAIQETVEGKEEIVEDTQKHLD